ncbi:MAG: hypothetical protein PVH19_04705, partial [Planctomycetia bacterium]
ITITDKRLYLRGKSIINRQFRHEISPNGNQINLVDGRNQVYKGVLGWTNAGKRLVLVFSEKERPEGIWDYFGTSSDRLVLEKADTKPDPKSLADDKSLRKTWHLMSSKPLINMSPESFSACFFVLDGEHYSLMNWSSANFLPEGQLKLDKVPGMPVDDAWPRRFAYHTNPSTELKQIDIVTDKYIAMKGIYRTEGDRLYIRLAPEDHARPGDFKSPLNENLVELEFCAPPASTPKLATLLITRFASVLDDQYFWTPPGSLFRLTQSPYDSCISHIAKRLKKHPEMKVVIDAPTQTSGLIGLRRRLLEAGAKSVQIKSNSLPPWGNNYFSIYKQKDLPKVYDISTNDLKTLSQQLPKPCKGNPEFLTNMMGGRGMGGMGMGSNTPSPLLGSTTSLESVDVQPNVIRIKLDSSTIKQLRDQKLKPTEPVAFILDNRLILAVTTAKKLLAGTIEIDCKLSEEERKILNNIFNSFTLTTTLPPSPARAKKDPG